MKIGKGFAKDKKRARIKGANYPKGEGSEVADQGLEVQPISYSSGSSKTLETTEGEERQNHAAANQGGQPAEAAPNPAEALPTEVPGAEAMPTKNSAQGSKRPSKKAGKEGVKKRRKATIPGENSEQPAEAMPTENSAQGSKRPPEEAGNQTKRARTENSNQNTTSAGTKRPVSAAEKQLNISKKLLSALRPGQSIRRVVNLLKQLADINAKVKFGGRGKHRFVDIKPVLVWAAYHNNTKAVELILKKGACPNESDDKGETALMKAARNGNLEIVKLLLEHKAKVDVENNIGYTALLFAASYWSKCPHEIALLLLENGADPKFVTKGNWTVLMNTSNNAEATQFFLNLGVDPNIVNKHGETALYYAIESGNAKVVKLLLEKGASPNEVYDKGNTALMKAAKNRNLKIVKLLLDYGADINIVNKDGMTALDLAADNSNRNIADGIVNLIIASVLFNQGQEGRNQDAFVTLLASGVLNKPTVLPYIRWQTATLIAVMGVDEAEASPLADTPEMRAIATFVESYNNSSFELHQNPFILINQIAVSYLRDLRNEIAEKSRAAKALRDKTDQIFLADILEANAAILNPAFLAAMFQKADFEAIFLIETAKLRAEFPDDAVLIQRGFDQEYRINFFKVRCEEIAALAAENVLESSIERLSNIHQVIAARLDEKPPFFRTNVITGNLTFLKLLDLTARKKLEQENPQQENPEQENTNLSALNPKLASALTLWKKLMADYETRAQEEEAATSLTEPTALSNQASTQITAKTHADIIMAAFLNVDDQERQNFANCLITVSKAGLKLDFNALREIFDFLNQAFSFSLLTRAENQALYRAIVATFKKPDAAEVQTDETGQADDNESTVSILSTAATIGRGDGEKNNIPASSVAPDGTAKKLSDTPGAERLI